MLCSISRFQVEAVHLFSVTLIKLWNTLRPLENEGFLRRIVKTLPTRIIRQRILCVIEGYIFYNLTKICDTFVIL